MKNVWLFSLLLLTSTLYSGDSNSDGLRILLDPPVQLRSVYTRLDALRKTEAEAKANEIVDALSSVNDLMNRLEDKVTKIGSLSRTGGRREICTVGEVRQVVAITRKIEELKTIRDKLMKDLETIVK